ncbi:hypothetical protein OUZ56_012588 [Daphnia magna]|uniref:Ig-like domain-containing protein n=1 Tax=Daphnia magna TaxID=35525 RepID=A0ABQ9Z3G3_9CRUS|nr:hypothetical protein OUZ56_012588 [Daphnia magna]
MTLPLGLFTVKIRGADPAAYFIKWFRDLALAGPSRPRGGDVLDHVSCYLDQKAKTVWIICLLDQKTSSHVTSKGKKAAVDYRPQAGLVATDMYLNIADMQPQDKVNYTCHCSNIYGTANWTISVEVVAMDAVQQRRMAQSSWSSELEEDEHENLENEDEFSSSPPETTTTRQTTIVQLSKTDTTTRKTIDANYRVTQETKRSDDDPPFLRQQKKASNKAGLPTSLTSKASANISSLFLLLLLINDNNE